MTTENDPSIEITLTRRELSILCHALNEVCNGIEIKDFEFLARLSANRDEVEKLANRLRANRPPLDD